MTEKSGNRHTTSELIELSKVDKKQDIIEQLLPVSGYIIIGGSNGTGKSLEMLHLMCAFASDNGTYHGLKTLSCKAIYIALEDDERKIGERLQQIIPQYKLKYTPIIYTPSNLYLDIASGAKELERIVTTERTNGNDIKVVIIDSLKYTINGDYLRPNEAKKWSDKVKEISKKLEIAFVFVHHTRKHPVMKQGHVETLLDSEAIKGAKDLVDHAESCVLMAINSVVKRDGASEHRIRINTLAVVKGRHAIVDLENNPLELDFDRDRLCWNGQQWKIVGKELAIVGGSNAN